ncbi:YicC/YloC family endoribonuclease [Neisseria wadsworthii]|uniref:K+-transporting ATPase n=1 Tax=Neisseria wadsworthii 9715 TaxID=1030841 RepID=G4CPR2_9NEIS|nr:YicC/YloC family endoribonuclease [Neisseria wadsworthii]EGZ47419.1 K+-transporting ATPase [Neisseria wadsworthii 9715]QMT34863.1 YicC family protein [Neisseria wadsworthii]
MTIHSMTGFANAVGECGGKRINLEIRAVNHRYLDVQFKMPDDLRYLESTLREKVAQYAVRGKVECRIQVQPLENGEIELNVNEALVGELAALNEKWRKKYEGLGKLTVADILKFQGVLVSQAADEEAFAKIVQDLLVQALEEFSETRRREGVKLQEHIVTRLDGMAEIVDALAELFPHLLQAYMEKIRARLAEAVENIDEDRLKQEFTLYLQKADVDEEFSRLRAHIAEVKRIVTAQKGSVGKRLDFLMQELNREANTLGSKAISAECTQASVELKVLIEQMREQVQNIE